MNGKQLSTQYKEHFSNYRQWDQLSHAEQYLLFPENLGSRLSIDETSLSNGELYTFLTNKEGHGGPGTLVAVVRGTKAEDVIRVLELLDRTRRRQVKEVTLDLSPSMMLSSPRPVSPMTASTCRSSTTMPWTTCASPTDGWHATWRTRKSRRPGKEASSTSRSAMPMEIPASSCWPGQSSSSLNSPKKNALLKDLRFLLFLTNNHI